MESDDDYQSFSPSSDSSLPVHLSKLKRLKKKSAEVLADPPPPKSMGEDLIPFTVDFAKIEALESSRTVIFDDSEERLQSESQSPSHSSEGLRDEKELTSGFDGLSVRESCGDGERGAEFEEDVANKVSDDLDERIANLRIGKLEKKRSGEGRSSETGEKKKKFKSVLPLSPADFAKLEALESSKILDFDDSGDSLQSLSPSEHLEDKEEIDNADEVPRMARRVLEFDDEFGGDGVGQGEKKEEKVRDNKSEKKRRSEGEQNEKKEKKKRVKSSSDEAKVKPTNKRKEEKERKFHLEQLHAESQRLLRETRGAGFKPVPLVQKPISSILQKIRQRKLEVSKKLCLLNNSVSTTENNDSSIEVMMNPISDKVCTKGGDEDNLLDKAQVEANTVASCDSSGSCLDADGIKGSRTQSSHEDDKPQMTLTEESTPTFRAPVDDTQDLFGDSETSDDKDQLNNKNCSPMEEVLAPSLLRMNLQIDSVPPDDDISSSSDEEDNDKENLDPYMHNPGVCSSPKGDPVKAFVDDEAEEEDDSDHDLRFQEIDEDEGIDDVEDLNDLIVTGYKEKPIDNERRNELHQKWLEQQDAAGTDNLMQRLGCGPKMKTLFDVEVESDEDDNEEEESGDDEKSAGPTTTTRVTTRKAKQMIADMFVDKEDGFVSSDDEETEKRLVKQRLLEKAGDQATLISPAEDESSREVFGLIKKLNNSPLPVTKKKQKAPSFFGTLVTGGSTNSSLKSSFLGRGSTHSLPSKQRCITSRSFIFGRDDSNSRNSISISEDSSDAVPKENKPMRNATTKFSSSQVKSITQSTQIVDETASGTLLIEILKRSSMQSSSCNQDTMVDLTQTAFSAFKIPQKAIKTEGRTKF